MPTWLNSFKRPLQLGLCVAAVVAAVTLFIPNYYRSEARILPGDGKGAGGLGNLAAAAAAFGVNVPGGDSNDASYVDILQSRAIREHLLKKEFTFHIRSWRFGAEKLRKQTLYDYLEVKNMDKAVRKMGQVVSVKRDSKTKLISLSSETKSPDLSLQITQQAVAFLESFVLEKGQRQGDLKADFSKARLKDARTEMAQAEAAFRYFLNGNRNYLASPDPSVRLEGGRLDMELRLRQQLVTNLALSYEQALLEGKNDIPVLNVLDEGNLPIEKSKPTRSLIVIFTFFVGSIGSFIVINREVIKVRLFEGDVVD